MRQKRSAIVIAAAAAGLSLLLSSCGLVSKGVYEAPLPGGADLGSNPLELTADFTDVLDLVPQSSVKVDDVAVGRVTKITLNNDARTARVRMKVNAEIELPAGTTARVQQTSLLGEKYISLLRPETPALGPNLASGAHLPLEGTSHAAGVEQVLGALSMLINGGGVAQFQEISRELQKANENPKEVRDFIRQMSKFATSLDERRDSITTALDGLAELGTTLDADKAKIESALEGLSPGMKVLADQRKDLVAMLASLDKLSGVTIRTLNAAQKDMVADFKLLAPILDQLAKSGQDLPESFEILLTYPFPDSILKAIKGDYINTFMVTNYATPGGNWDQPITPAMSAVSMGKTKSSNADEPPMLLQPTDSATPGVPSPTVPDPAPSPTPDASPAPDPSPGDDAQPTPDLPLGVNPEPTSSHPPASAKPEPTDEPATEEPPAEANRTRSEDD